MSHRFVHRLALTSAALLPLFLSMSSLSAAPLSAEAEVARDQGVLYFEQEMFPRAKEQLLIAESKLGGGEDFKTLYFLAKVNYKLLIIEEAFRYVDAATPRAGSDGERERVESLRDELSRLFGPVEFTALSPGATRGPIHIDSKTRFLNARKRKLFASIQARLKSQQIQLPAVIYLPFGRYNANGRPVEISRGAEDQPSVSIYLGPAGEAAPAVASAGGDATWKYVGIGAGSVALGVLTYLFFQPEPREERVSSTSFSVDQ